MRKLRGVVQVGPGQVWHRAVPAGAVDADREAVGGRHDRARLREWKTWVWVQKLLLGHSSRIRFIYNCINLSSNMNWC